GSSYRPAHCLGRGGPKRISGRAPEGFVAATGSLVFGRSGNSCRRQRSHWLRHFSQRNLRSPRWECALSHGGPSSGGPRESNLWQQLQETERHRRVVKRASRGG